MTVPPAVSPAQRNVLYAVRRRGEATVSDIATCLAMTPSGARQHLAGLVELGLLEVGDAARLPGQTGRVERVYRLAPPAESLFPRAYGELTNQLLGFLPHDAVSDAFDRRRDLRIEAARARLAPKRGLRAKVTELARILDEDGYFASVEPMRGGGFRVAEHNCAIFAVAGEHPQACSTEIEFIRAVLPEARVERTSHMLSGAHACSYEIRPAA